MRKGSITFIYVCVLCVAILTLVAALAVCNSAPFNCDKSAGEARMIYARGALSSAMRDMCEKQWRSGHIEYGSPKYRAYTFEHGEPKDCDELLRILKEIGEK